MFVGMFIFSSLSITLGYHRLFAHMSFKAKWPSNWPLWSGAQPPWKIQPSTGVPTIAATTSMSTTTMMTPTA